MSSNGARAERIETLDCPDEELVDAIRDLQLQHYRLNSNQLLANRNAEDEALHEYTGRVLLELPQNADEAVASECARPAKLIAAKGIGFKAVLEITDQPKIFSRPFRFSLDYVWARECLSGRAHQLLQ